MPTRTSSPHSPVADSCPPRGVLVSFGFASVALFDSLTLSLNLCPKAIAYLINIFQNPLLIALFGVMVRSMDFGTIYLFTLVNTVK
jgi:hypothetical protein